MREVVNAIFFVLRGGIPWRMLPEHFPPHQTSYAWFARFRDDGTWEKLNHHLLMLDRERAGRDAKRRRHGQPERQDHRGRRSARL
jgi:putative transposase